MVLPWKRGANEALGAGWLLRRGFCAPDPCASFAASANLQVGGVSAEIEGWLLIRRLLKIAVSDHDIDVAEGRFSIAKVKGV